MIRKKGGKSTPKISTASLPDIVFMLLFFFMVVTVMRSSEILVEIKYPKATELQKLQKKSRVHYIYVGPPIGRLEKELGTAPRIQLNDKIVDNIEDIRSFVINERTGKDEKLISKLITSLKIDGDTKMGLISDIKQQLRLVNQLKINYSSAPRTEEL